MKRMPVWRSAESSPGASARAVDGTVFALRPLFGKGGAPGMDMSIEAPVSQRVDIRHSALSGAV